VADEGGEASEVTDNVPQSERRTIEPNAKEPGWYPTRTSPNDQAYWDGTAWIARRRWTSGGWVSVGDTPASPEPDLISANPYVRPTPATARIAGTTYRQRSNDSALSLGLVLLLGSGVLLMVGSVTTWIHASASFGTYFHLSVSLNGLDAGTSSLFGINGFATFTCGVVLVGLGCAAMAGDDSSMRLLTLVVGLTSLAFASYFVVRVIEKVTNGSGHGSATVGTGIILLAIGGFLAGVVPFGRLAQNR
jgi:hypothetical protein